MAKEPEKKKKEEKEPVEPELLSEWRDAPEYGDGMRAAWRDPRYLFHEDSYDEEVEQQDG